MLLCAVPTLGGADYRVAAIEFFGHKGAWKGPPEAIVEALARDRGAHGAL
jgi:hypothetical protein